MKIHWASLRSLFPIPEVVLPPLRGTKKSCQSPTRTWTGWIQTFNGIPTMCLLLLFFNRIVFFIFVFYCLFVCPSTSTPKQLMNASECRRMSLITFFRIRNPNHSFSLKNSLELFKLDTHSDIQRETEMSAYGCWWHKVKSADSMWDTEKWSGNWSTFQFRW